MDKLIKLTQKIKDEKLRKMVVDFLKIPSLSNKHFKKYPRMEIEKAASLFTVGGPTTATVQRDVLNHTIALTEVCEKVADVLEKSYGLPLNRDNLIAAAILHDIMKIFEWKLAPGSQELEHTGIMLDHTMLGVAELYSRGFPEDLIHIVAAHFGESGPTPPRNFEALIFHHLDNMLSILEFRLLAPAAQAQQAVQMILLDEASLKKLGEQSETENQGSQEAEAEKPSTEKKPK
jgi:7,8-dihydroneopterin 2',3'-cyclic phosphate phosphodiesterase